jgi:2-dehydro-3-deoxygluconokinase
VTTETMTPPAPYVVTFGETMALFRTERPGPLVHAGTVALGIGGAESNVAIGLQRLGVQAVWCGRIGADALGELVRREIQAEGVVVHAVEDPAAPTGLMVKEQRTPSVQRVTYYRAGSAASRIAPPDVNPALIAGAAVVHATGITPALSEQAAATWRHVIGAARAAGVLVSLDMNYRSALWNAQAAARVYRDVLPMVDVLFAGEDEAAIALGLQSAEHQGEVRPEELARRLAGMGPAQVVIKRGAAGAYALIDGTAFVQQVVRIEPVDTVGAGDAFVAGYLAELVRGLPPAERLHTAARTGAFACLTQGDWEGLPRRSELGILEAREPVVR